MKTNHKFKVGDKVRFISKDSPNADYFKCPVDNLEIRELTKNEYDYQVYEQDKSLSWGVNEEELELIPETYKYEVVHTETQEQWDFVCKIQNYENINWSSYGKESCINLSEKGYADKDGIAYGNGQAKIYSFEEWLDKFGHKSEYLKQNQQLDKFPNEGHCKSLDKDLINYLIETRGTTDCKGSKDRSEGVGWNYTSYWYLRDCNNSNKPKYELEQLSKFFNKKQEQWTPQVGDYVITEGYSGRYDGRILKIIKIDSNRYYYFEVFDRGYYDKTHNFSKKSISRKALPHEIPTQELSKEDLLAEAKRRFPIGTQFKTAKTRVLRTVNSNIKIFSVNPLTLTCETEEATQKAAVYIDGTWAEIVEEPKVKGNKVVVDIEGNATSFCEKQLDWSQVLRSTGEFIFEAPYQKTVKNNKILPIKVRNSNITESTELPKRTRIKIIKKQLLTI